MDVRRGRGLVCGFFYRIERVESEVPYDGVIPEGVEMVGTENWSGECSVGSVRVPDSMRYISDYAFYRCGKLRSVSFGYGVKRIGAHAFSRCSALEEIELPDSLEVIEAHAFEGCSGLRKLHLPGGVREVGEFAFSGCSEEVLYLVSRMEESEAYEQKAMRVYKLWGLL
jgi:hypothetical protein